MTKRIEINDSLRKRVKNIKSEKMRYLHKSLRIWCGFRKELSVKVSA